MLLGLAKLVTRRALAATPLVDAAYLAPLFAGYFPRAFREAWPDALGEHRLRREITALVVTNRLVDAGGAALVPSLVAELGVGIADVAAALLLAEDVLEIGARRAALLALPIAVSRDAIYAALLEIDRGVRSVARLLVKSGGAALDVAARRAASRGSRGAARGSRTRSSPKSRRGRRASARRRRSRAASRPSWRGMPAIGQIADETLAELRPRRLAFQLVALDCRRRQPPHVVKSLARTLVDR